jgi:hypothetical protein
LGRVHRQPKRLGQAQGRLLIRHPPRARIKVNQVAAAIARAAEVAAAIRSGLLLDDEGAKDRLAVNRAETLEPLVAILNRLGAVTDQAHERLGVQGAAHLLDQGFWKQAHEDLCAPGKSRARASRDDSRQRRTEDASTTLPGPARPWASLPDPALLRRPFILFT